MPVVELKKKAEHITDIFCREFSFKNANLFYADCQSDVLLIQYSTQRHVMGAELKAVGLLKALNIVRYRLNMRAVEWAKKTNICDEVLNIPLTSAALIFDDMVDKPELQNISLIMKLEKPLGNKRGRGGEEDKLMREFTKNISIFLKKGARWCRARVFNGNKVVYIAHGITDSIKIFTDSGKIAEQRLAVEAGFKEYFSSIYPAHYIGVRYLLKEDNLYILVDDQNLL